MQRHVGFRRLSKICALCHSQLTNKYLGKKACRLFMSKRAPKADLTGIRSTTMLSRTMLTTCSTPAKRSEGLGEEERPHASRRSRPAPERQEKAGSLARRLAWRRLGYAYRRPILRSMLCPACDGMRWVCEEHTDRPWGAHPRACQCGGAGMPCLVCNQPKDDERPSMPPDFVSQLDRDKGPIN